MDVVLAAHDPTLRTALEVAAVPHWFDARILGTLLETDTAAGAAWVEQLSKLPMVESFAARGGWNVHEATRLALSNRLGREQPDRLRRLSDLAATCFDGADPSWRAEAIYHRLSAAPEEAAGQLEQLWKEWDNAGRYEALQTLGVALDELIRTPLLAAPARARSLICLGWIRRKPVPSSTRFASVRPV